MPLRKIHHPAGACTAEEKKEFAEMNLTDHAGVRLTHGKPKVNGVEIHYAIGGVGAVGVLLDGGLSAVGVRIVLAEAAFVARTRPGRRRRGRLHGMPLAGATALVTAGVKEM
jgi:hypothetical protein